MGLLQTTPHAGFPEGFFGNFIPAEPLRLKTSPRNLHHLLQSAGNMGGLCYVWNIEVIHWIVSAKKYHLSRKARAGRPCRSQIHLQKSDGPIHRMCSIWILPKTNFAACTWRDCPPLKTPGGPVCNVIAIKLDFGNLKIEAVVHCH
jgi:hypothetical protein